MKRFYRFLYSNLIILIVGVVTAFLFFLFSALPIIDKGLFLWQWAPSIHQFGMLGAILGTLMTVFLPVLFVAPVVIVAALSLRFLPMPSPLKHVLTVLLDCFSSIPPVVYGVLYWQVIQSLGPDAFSQFYAEPLSILILLGMMIAPYMMAICYQLCLQFPEFLMQQGIVLGGTRGQVLRIMVWPYLKPGFIQAVLFSMMRLLSETMIVLMLWSQNFLTLSSLVSGDWLSLLSKDHYHTLILAVFILCLLSVSFQYLAKRYVKDRFSVSVVRGVI